MKRYIFIAVFAVLFVFQSGVAVARRLPPVSPSTSVPLSQTYETDVVPAGTIYSDSAIIKTNNFVKVSIVSESTTHATAIVEPRPGQFPLLRVSGTTPNVQDRGARVVVKVSSPGYTDTLFTLQVYTT